MTRFTDTHLATSLVHGITVTAGCYPIGQTGGYSYVAVFEKDGVIFTIESSGLRAKLYHSDRRTDGIDRYVMKQKI